MNKLALAALGASALALPTTVSAQAVGHQGAGHSWRHPGGNTIVHHRGGGGFRGGFVGGGFVGGGFGGGFGGGNSQVIILPGNHGQFHYQPLTHGGVLHPYWLGPQFHVRSFERYGFARPPRGHRWVRHFNDAYMIDGRGHVRDFRHGLDWDRYGERWSDEGGISRYVGDGDYRPDERDVAYVEGQQRDWDYQSYGQTGYAGGYPPPGALPPPGYLPLPPPGYGSGYGHSTGAVSYGHVGYGGGVMTITETTTYVQPAETSYREEIIEEVVHVRRPRVRRAARPCNCAPRPRVVRPPAGERG